MHRAAAALLVRDIENTYLQLEAPDESAMSDLLGHSLTSTVRNCAGVIPAKPAAYPQPLGAKVAPH